jgi:hypothetical protein
LEEKVKMKRRSYIESILVGVLLPLSFLAVLAALGPAAGEYSWFPLCYWGIVVIAFMLALAFLILRLIDTRDQKQ